MGSCLPRDPWRHVLVVASIIHSLFTSGLVYGFVPLQALMRREGIYANLCGPDSPPEASCDERDTRYNLMFSIGASLIMFSQPFHGIVLDKVGPRASALLVTFGVLLGSLLFVFSNDETFDAYVPAFAIMGAAGGGSWIFPYQFTNFFPDNASKIMAFMSGTVGFSGSLYTIANFLSEDGFITLYEVFLFLSVVDGVLIAFVLWTYPSRSVAVGDTCRMTGCRPKLISPTPTDETSQLNIQDGQAPPAAAPPSLGSQMRQPEFILLVVFVAVAGLLWNAYIGTISIQLAGRGDVTGFYTRIFSVIQPLGGFTPSFIVGVMQDRDLHVPAFLTVLVFGIAYSAVNLINVIQIQPIAFVLFTLHVECLFAAFNTFLAKVFGFDNFGVLSGVVCFATGILVLVQILTLNTVLTTFKGNFSVINIIFTATYAPLVLIPIFLWRRARSCRSGPDMLARQDTLKDDEAIAEKHRTIKKYQTQQHYNQYQTM